MPKNALVKVQGTQQFMGKEIPVVLGGFGENCKVMLAKTIAEIHKMETKHVNELINRNIKRFKNEIDILDLGVVLNDTGLKELGFTQQAINSYKGLRAKGQGGNIYLLSERGYAKLIKIMDTDLAWEIHDQLMDEYFHLREEHKPLLEYNQELQELDKVSKAIGLGKKDKLIAAISILQKHQMPTLGLEHILAGQDIKVISCNPETRKQAVDYITNINPEGRAITEYYQAYTLHCVRGGIENIGRITLSNLIKELGYKSKSKRINGEVRKAWTRTGGN